MIRLNRSRFRCNLQARIRHCLIKGAGGDTGTVDDPLTSFFSIHSTVRHAVRVESACLIYKDVYIHILK